jgi:hypothetical protein
MKTRTLPLILTLLAALISFAPAAYALHVVAGWTDADIGLEERGNGFYAGVQESWALGTGMFDFTAAGEYLQKAGSMHRYYSDPHTGLTYGEAKVRLHCFQTAGFIGMSIPVSSFTPRLYTGASVVLNLSNSWDEPEGSTDGDYSYENMDFQVHLGLTIEVSRFLLDVRYSTGLLGQVIDRTNEIANPNKAEVEELPENGAKINSVQVGIGYSF